MVKVAENKLGMVADLLLVLVAVIWGMGFPVTQMAIDANMDASLIMSLRFWIATLLLGVVFFSQIKTITRRELLLGSIAGVLLGIGFMFQTVGLKYTTPSNNAFLTSTNVIMVPFFCWAVYRQRPVLRQLLAAFGCFIGAAILSFSAETGIQFNLGDILTLGCAVVYSIHLIYLSTLTGRITTSKLTFLQMFSCAAFCTLYMLLFERDAVAKADFAAGALPVLYMGFLSTSFCFFAQTFAQKHTSATKTSIILGTEGLLGSIFSVLLGYEPLTVNLIAGGTVIFTSLLAMELFPRKVQMSQEVVSEDGATKTEE